VVAEITTDIESTLEVAQAARRQRLLEYLLALGQGDAQAHKELTQMDQQSASLSKLLLAARARHEQCQPPGLMVTPAQAPLSMPVRDIPLRQLNSPMTALASLFGQPKHS
jgi:hypothetical protein